MCLSSTGCHVDGLPNATLTIRSTSDSQPHCVNCAALSSFLKLITRLSRFSHYYQETINVLFTLFQWWLNQHEGGYVRSSRGSDKTSLTEGGNCWESAGDQLSVQWPLTVSISQPAILSRIIVAEWIYKHQFPHSRITCLKDILIYTIIYTYMYIVRNLNWTRILACWWIWGIVSSNCTVLSLTVNCFHG
jgi:hypothetical protein